MANRRLSEGQSFTLRMSLGVMTGGKRRRTVPLQHCASKTDFCMSSEIIRFLRQRPCLTMHNTTCSAFIAGEGC